MVQGTQPTKQVKALEILIPEGDPVIHHGNFQGVFVAPEDIPSETAFMVHAHEPCFRMVPAHRGWTRRISLQHGPHPQFTLEIGVF